MPVKELMTAAPPVNNIAVTRMLVMMPKTVKTLDDIRCATEQKSNTQNQDLQVSGGTKSSFDDFKERMRIWCPSLKLDGDTGKEQDLNRGTRSIPKWSGDSIIVRDGGTLQQSCSPLQKCRG
jgi:hypothetical protein